MVPQANLEDPELQQCVEFIRLADAIVVGIDPDPQAAVDGVAWIDEAVPVAAVGGLVKYGQRKKAIRFRAGRLRRQVSEEFGQMSILPFPLRSSANQPFRRAGSVQLICRRGPPGVSRNLTPFATLVRWKPSSKASSTIGEL
jgi:hypothetical protein